MRPPLRLAAALAAGVLAALGAAAPAWADVVDEGEPGLLSIDAEPRSLDLEFDPGDEAFWLLTAQLDDAPSDGELLLRIRRTGLLATHPGGLLIEVEECAHDWEPVMALSTGAGCPVSPEPVLGPVPLAVLGDDAVWELGGLPDGGARRFLVTVSLPEAAPGELQGASGRFEFEFAASGDVETVGEPPVPGEPLVPTGVAVGAPLALAAALGVLGALLRGSARRPRRSER